MARTVHLESRLRVAEEAAAAAAAAVTNRTAALSTAATPFEPSLSVAAAPGCESNDSTACRYSKENGTAATKMTSADDNPSERMERVGAEDIAQPLHQEPMSRLLRRAEIAAIESRAEVDTLRGELEAARAEKSKVVAAATEEIRASGRRVSELEVVIEETKREYQSHRDKAESRLETLRVAFDQENEENRTHVSGIHSSDSRGLL